MQENSSSPDAVRSDSSGAEPLEYESRSDTRARWRERLQLRRAPPEKPVRILAWTGIASLLWGSASLPGGTAALMLGIVVATTGLVPILLWEVGTRPRLLMKGVDALDAPPVPHRGWIIALFCVAVTGFVTETTAQVVSTLTRPLWLPSVEYYYDGRPAIAPAPNVLVLGPYVLLQPRITPVGIRGGVAGGGEIAIKWDEVRGYQFKSSYDRVD